MSRAAWDALTVTFAALNGWMERSADLLTAGLRDAYRQGLSIAFPVAAETLGWAMDANRSTTTGESRERKS